MSDDIFDKKIKNVVMPKIHKSYISSLVVNENGKQINSFVLLNYAKS